MPALHHTINPTPHKVYETAYIYALLDPETRKVRYIGKSINPEMRLYGHLAQCGQRRSLCQRWLHGLKKAQKRPLLRIVEAVVQGDWADREIHWIAHFRAIGADLVNSTRGGSGEFQLTPEASLRMRAAQSAARMGMKFSPEHVANMRAGKKKFYDSRPDIKLAISRRQAALTDDQVVEVYRLAASREMKQSEIARRFGISQSTISFILSGRRYPYVARPNIVIQPNYEARGKERKAIACRLLREGVPTKEIARRFGMSHRNVVRILETAGAIPKRSVDYEERWTRAIVMRRQGADNNAIAREFGITNGGVWRMFKRIERIGFSVPIAEPVRARQAFFQFG